MYKVTEADRALLQKAHKETYDLMMRSLTDKLTPLAMRLSGVTEAQFAYMSEHDSDNPKYELVYANLSLLIQKVLTTVSSNMYLGDAPTKLGT